MPDRFGKISINNPPAPPPDAPEAIAVPAPAPEPAAAKEELPVKAGPRGKGSAGKKRPQGKRRPAWLLWPAVLALLVALYGVLGFFALPSYLSRSLAEGIKSATGYTLQPGVLSFNPFTFHFSVSEARLTASDGKPLAVLGHLEADLAPVSLLRLDLVCNTVTLSALSLYVTREQDGSYNVARLFQDKNRDGSTEILDFSDLPFFFSLNNIVVREGKILFNDMPTGKTHSVENLHMELPSFSNIPFESSEYLQPRFSAVINGSPVELAGNAFLGNSGDKATTLSANLHGVELPLYAAYLPSPLPLVFTGGTVDGKIDFIFDPTSSEEDKLAVDFDLQVSAVEVNTSEESLFLTAPRTAVSGRLRPIARTVAFKTITAQTPAAHTFGKTFVASLLPLFAGEKKIDKASPNQAITTPASSPLAVTIDTLRVEDGAFHLWAEKGAGKPASTWQTIDVDISGYTSATPRGEGEEGAFSLSGAAGDGSSTFSWQGKLASSTSQSGEFNLGNYELAPLLTALGADATLDVSGRADFRGRLTVSLPEKAGASLSFKVADGDLSAREVKVFEGKNVVFHAPTLHCTSLGTALQTINFGKISVSDGDINLRLGEIPPVFKAFSGGRYLLQELDYKGRLTLHKDGKGKKQGVYEDLAITAKNLDTLEKAKENLKVAFKTPSGGTVEGQGDLRLAPFLVTLEARFAALAAEDILPLLGRSPLISGMSGTLSGQGTFIFPRIAFSGDISVAEGSAPVPGTTAPAWKNLSLQGLDYSSEPPRLSLAAARFEQPQFTWQLGKHEKGPLAQIATLWRELLPQPSSERREGEELPAISLQNISCNDGTIIVHDQRLKPKWQGEVSGFSGSIAAIDSAKMDEGGKYSFTGKLDGAPFTVEGSLSLFVEDGRGDYRLNLDHYPLSSLQAQLTRLAEIDSKGGQITLGLEGQPRDGVFHESGSLVVAGVKAKSAKTDAALALALLTGPENTFSLGFDLSSDDALGKDALVDELVGLFQTKVVKAAVSPLLLASGEYSDLIGNEFITFEPGLAVISESGKAILERYVELLRTHPLLAVELSGGVDRNSDTPGLKEQLLARERQRVEEENQRRYQEWLKEKELFEQKVAEQLKKQGAKTKGAEASPAVLKDYIPLQPKAVTVDNALLLELARRRVELLQRLLVEELGIASARVVVEPLKKVPAGQPDGQEAPLVRIALSPTR